MYSIEEMCMITRLGVEDRNINSVYTVTPKKNNATKDPSFKGGNVWGALLWGIQKCEANPMVNVAVVDMFSAILPRTFVESMTNWFAGFEAFRRESSGLIVNCLIPSLVTFVGALALNKAIMPKGANMASCWADHSLIERATETYTKSNATDKVYDSLREILGNTEGVHGKKKVLFKEAIRENLDNYAQRLTKLTESNVSNKELSKEVEKIAKEIAEQTHVFENVKVKNGKEVSANTVKTLLEDTVKFFREYKKTGKDINIEEFAKKSKKLVKGKTALGLAIILPLAASMQYINRWITKKVSGVDGAPIYEDFGKNQNEEIRKQSQEGLLKQKIISISSMIGVSLLSMMKKPSWNMLEFKGWFPTMDQARIISTTTFASRMAVADDKNELAETTARDIVTFAGLYFLGDYAGKAAATLIEKKKGIQLLNSSKDLEKDANVFKRFWHWVKDVNIKSSEEVVSKTAELLKEKGLKPSEEQQKTILKELKQAKNLRSACQVANLGVSLLLLGLIVPIWTRSSTKKKHAEALKQADEKANLGINNETKESKDSKLTMTKH